MSFVFVAFVGLVFLGWISGGSTNTKSTESGSIGQPDSPQKLQASSTPPTQKVAPPTPIASDGSQIVGVWKLKAAGWRTAKNIGGQFGETAGEGETFVVVNFTIQNNTKETQNCSSIIDQPHLALADGSVIDSDTMLSIQAGSQVVDG